MAALNVSVRTDTAWCDVWLASLDSAATGRDVLLDEAELARADRFLSPDDRRRFVLGVTLVKLAVADDANIPPAEVRVDRSCPTCGEAHGRPRIPGSTIQASVTHSGSLVAVALTRAGPVGIDVQVRNARTALPLRRVLAPEEPVSVPEDLFTYWCRKESVAKATGEGVAVPFDEVVVSPAQAPARLVSYRGRPLAASLTDLDVGPGYCAALAILTDTPVRVDVHNAENLFHTNRSWT